MNARSRSLRRCSRSCSSPLRQLAARLALAAVALAWGGGDPAAGGSPETPNIVIILSDDYGYGSVGCYGADGKLVQTPHLDRLAREGRRFTDANTTSSVCSPTRYSVLTGRYCWRTSLTHEVLGTFSPLHIEPSRLTMASLLKQHGYHSAAIGKWHLGYGTADAASPAPGNKWRTDYTAELSPGPLDLGFDYHFGVPSNHGDMTGVFVENRFVYGLRSGKIPPGMKVAGPVPDSDDFQPDYTLDDTEGRRSEPMAIDAPRRKNDRVMPVLTDKAVQFIQQQQAGRPFFLFFTPVAVHNPVTPARDLAGRSAAGPFGDWIAELDRSVGRVLDALDRKGFSRQTLVLFTSDNGGVCELQREDLPQTAAIKAGLAVNGRWRGGKHHIWEGGFRVPFLVRWPDRAPAGTVCDEPVSLADLLATVAAVVGHPLPSPQAGAEDSFNILPAIVGHKSDQPLRPDLIQHSADGVFAIRQGPWKWIEGVPVDEIRAGARRARAAEYRAQLFNLHDDPAESRDVLAEHPEVARRLEALLIRYRDGGYSRALPPPVDPPAAVTLPPRGNRPLLDEPLAAVPGAPWVLVRGRWEARDGAVRAWQKPADTGPAAMRYPLAFTDADLEYQVAVPPGCSHVLRVQGRDPNDVLLIHISPRRLAIARQPVPGEPPGRSSTAVQRSVMLKPDAWIPVRVAFRGPTIAVQAGDAAVDASLPQFSAAKVAFALLANGENVGFTRLKVAAPSP